MFVEFLTFFLREMREFKQTKPSMYQDHLQSKEKTIHFTNFLGYFNDFLYLRSESSNKLNQIWLEMKFLTAISAPL